MMKKIAVVIRKRGFLYFLRSAVPSNSAGTFLLGLIAFSRGVFYSPMYYPDDSISVVETVMPVGWWALVWALIGFIGMVSAFMSRFKNQMFGVLLGMHFLWGTVYLVAFSAGLWDRGYVTAATYYGFVVLALWGASRAPVYPQDDELDAGGRGEQSSPPQISRPN